MKHNIIKPKYGKHILDTQHTKGRMGKSDGHSCSFCTTGDV